ncbi:hypothetical protein [Lentilactobacillus parafarraginis]|nr:hypothetical protein [Lentilactobacillus parafarraginis]
MKKIGWMVVALGLAWVMANGSVQAADKSQSQVKTGAQTSSQSSTNVVSNQNYVWTKFLNRKEAVAYYALSGSSAYMWNATHTKPLHKLKNYPKTTWYVKNSVVIKHGNRSNVYYELYSPYSAVTGYVWRGALTKGLNPDYKGTALKAVMPYTLANKLDFFRDNLKTLANLPQSQFANLVTEQVTGYMQGKGTYDPKLSTMAKLLATQDISNKDAATKAGIASPTALSFTVKDVDTKTMGGYYAYWLKHKDTNALRYYAVTVYLQVKRVAQQSGQQHFGMYIVPDRSGTTWKPKLTIVAY